MNNDNNNTKSHNINALIEGARQGRFEWDSLKEAQPFVRDYVLTYAEGVWVTRPGYPTPEDISAPWGVLAGRLHLYGYRGPTHIDQGDFETSWVEALTPRMVATIQEASTLRELVSLRGDFARAVEALTLLVRGRTKKIEDAWEAKVETFDGMRSGAYSVRGGNLFVNRDYASLCTTFPALFRRASKEGEEIEALKARLEREWEVSRAGDLTSFANHLYNNTPIRVWFWEGRLRVSEKDESLRLARWVNRKTLLPVWEEEDERTLEL